MRIVPETAMFWQACLLGAMLGILYDGFRVLRLAGANHPAAVFAEDLLFSAAAAGVTFWFCLTRCSGWLRAFVLAGEGLGFLVYHFTVGEAVMWAAEKLLRAVLWTLKGLEKLFFRWPVSLICGVLHKIRILFSQNLQKLKNKYFLHKNSLQVPCKMLYNENNKQNSSERMAASYENQEK